VSGGEWAPRLQAIGLSTPSARDAAARFARIEALLPPGDAPTRAWWVPGRIEVFGKHTDYGGGRSLLCAVTRAIHVVVRPRADDLVTIVDADSSERFEGRIHPDLEPQPGDWRDYPISVLRRVARDFLLDWRGADLVISSTLPRAAGLSSSSALVIATFLPLAAINLLSTHPLYPRAIATPDALGEYLGAVENGKAYGPFPADRGVGTQGGSQDQIAILRSRAGQLVQYHYLPVRHERSVALPSDWCFVIATSGVHAEKGGAAQEHYNALAAEMQALLATWNARGGDPVSSLFHAIQTAGLSEVRNTIAHHFGADSSQARRFTQFARECTELIPSAAEAARTGDARAFAHMAALSFALGDQALNNQIPETRALVAVALERGAIAASPFGAGFGGAVWALIPREKAEYFPIAWRNSAAHALKIPSGRMETFVTEAGPPASEV
jgi:galactokinase